MTVRALVTRRCRLLIHDANDVGFGDYRVDASLAFVLPCDAIAKLIGRTERATYHLIAQKKLPTFRLDGRHSMRPSAWRRHCEELERQHMEATG